METKLSKYSYIVPGSEIVLIFRFPTVKESRFIEGEFAKEDNFAGFVKAINTILVGWENTEQMYTGDVADVLTEIDVLVARSTLLSRMQEFELEFKKKCLTHSLSSSNNSAMTPETSEKTTPS